MSFKGSSEHTESILLELVLILNDLSQYSNVRVFFCHDCQKCYIPIVEGDFSLLFSQYYLNSKSVAFTLNFLLLKIEIVEGPKGTLGLSGVSWGLIYEQKDKAVNHSGSALCLWSSKFCVTQGS